MDQRVAIVRRAQELRSRKRLSRRRLLKLADKTEEATQREEDLDGRDEAPLRGSRP